MGLDASVFCDCLERGRLHVPPRPEWGIYADEQGYRMRLHCTGLLEDDLEFDRWNYDACEHEWGIRLHHRIGNIATVGRIRKVLSEHPGDQFPLILSKVVYNGTHACDSIAAGDVPSLMPEILALSALHCRKTLTEEIIRNFENQLRELVAVAMELGRPIVF